MHVSQFPQFRKKIACILFRTCFYVRVERPLVVMHCSQTLRQFRTARLLSKIERKTRKIMPNCSENSSDFKFYEISRKFSQSFTKICRNFTEVWQRFDEIFAQILVKFRYSAVTRQANRAWLDESRVLTKHARIPRRCHQAESTANLSFAAKFASTFKCIRQVSFQMN